MYKKCLFLSGFCNRLPETWDKGQTTLLKCLPQKGPHEASWNDGTCIAWDVLQPTVGLANEHPPKLPGSCANSKSWPSNASDRTSFFTLLTWHWSQIRKFRVSICLFMCLSIWAPTSEIAHKNIPLMACNAIRATNNSSYTFAMWTNCKKIHQPRFSWNKGMSLAQLHFGVRSCEVAINWPDAMPMTVTCTLLCVHDIWDQLVLISFW